MKIISSSPSSETQPKPLSDAQVQRRKFLLQCGRYGAVTPPAIALLLAGGGAVNYAVARSGGVSSGGGGSDPLGTGDPPSGGGGGGAGGGTFQDNGALNAYEQRGWGLDCGPGDKGNPACDGGGGQSNIGDSTRIGPIKP